MRILKDARQREIERVRVLQQEASGRLADDLARLNEKAVGEARCTTRSVRP